MQVLHKDVHLPLMTATYDSTTADVRVAALQHASAARRHLPVRQSHLPPCTNTSVGYKAIATDGYPASGVLYAPDFKTMCMIFCALLNCTVTRHGYTALLHKQDEAAG